MLLGIAVHQTMRGYIELLRAMLLLCFVPWFVSLPAIMLTLPESMRWLLVGRRFQEARELLKDLDSAKGIELVAVMVRGYSGRRLNGWNYTASACCRAPWRSPPALQDGSSPHLMIPSVASFRPELIVLKKTATKLHVPGTSFLCIYSCCVTNHDESPVLACVLASVP